MPYCDEMPCSTSQGIKMSDSYLQANVWKTHQQPWMSQGKRSQELILPNIILGTLCFLRSLQGRWTWPQSKTTAKRGLGSLSLAIGSLCYSTFCSLQAQYWDMVSNLATFWLLSVSANSLVKVVRSASDYWIHHLHVCPVSHWTSTDLEASIHWSLWFFSFCSECL